MKQLEIVKRTERKGETSVYRALHNSLIDVLDVINKDNKKLMSSIRTAVRNMTNEMTDEILLSLMESIRIETVKLRRYQ